MTRDTKRLMAPLALAVFLTLTTCPCLQAAARPSQLATVFSRCQDRVARGSQMTASHVHSRLQCARDCAKMAACQVAQVRGGHSDEEIVECRLMTKVTSSSDCRDWTLEIGSSSLVKRDSICGIGGVNISGSCECPRFTYGPSCENIIPNCVDKAGFTSEDNGIGMVWPPSFPAPVLAKCGFGWNSTAAFLRPWRAAVPPVLFNRSWEDYKWGFGDENGFWFGLENVYRMSQILSLRAEVTIGLTEGWTTGVYFGSHFGDESSGYAFTFSRFAAYGFSRLHPAIASTPRKFCTLDRDCNGCAALHQGAGWWYGPNCETGGATYPRDEMWWPLEDGTKVFPIEIFFNLIAF